MVLSFYLVWGRERSTHIFVIPLEMKERKRETETDEKINKRKR